MKLSILVPSVAERRNTFLPKSLDMLYGQLESLPGELQSEVEIIYLIDNKSIMLGDKRNLMVSMAAGDYIAFVDCDDRIEPDYITTLLEATKSNADSIVFHASVSLNGQDPKICKYSKDYPRDYNTATEYHRLPNHICCVKRGVSKKVSFPSLKRAEDSGYSRLLKPHLRSEFKIDRVLYHYDYNDMTTVAQEDIPQIRAKRLANGPVIVDIVFISDAVSHGAKSMTQNAINTAIQGANGLKVNCIVIESKSGVTYQNATTYYPSHPFNYNAYLNFGAKQGQSENILFCNNDLKFQNGWLHALISANYPVVSPICIRDKRQQNVNGNETGWACGRNLSGWCFMLSRKIWEQIGGLDEDFDFWYADNSLICQLKAIDLPPMLVPLSRVDHLGSMTLKDLPKGEKESKMWSKLELFNKKYNENLFTDHPLYLRWKKSQSV